MPDRVLNFVRYHNAFALLVVILFSGFGVSYAASPEVRDAVYSSKQVVVSVDNSAIVSADLDSFNFNLKVNAITEDAKNYYAAYSYQILAIEDGAWQVKQVNDTLTVNKEALGGKDLGLYVAKELGDNMDYELSYLKRVQKLEREKGESQKVVATEYSGIVGKLLNPKNGTIEGYTPVVPESAAVAAATGDTSNVGAPVAPIINPERPAQTAENTDTTGQTTGTQTTIAISSPPPTGEEPATTTSSGSTGETASSTPSSGTTETAASSTPPSGTADTTASSTSPGTIDTVATSTEATNTTATSSSTPGTTDTGMTDTMSGTTGDTSATSSSTDTSSTPNTTTDTSTTTTDTTSGSSQ